VKRIGERMGKNGREGERNEGERRGRGLRAFSQFQFCHCCHTLRRTDDSTSPSSRRYVRHCRAAEQEGDPLAQKHLEKDMEK